MAIVVSCPNGHRWQPPEPLELLGNGQVSVCPECGASSIENPLDEADLLDAALVDTKEWSAEGRPPTKLPELAGFEVLAKLGEGGMGVVYLARQQSPKRVVAIKMISAAAHAYAEKLKRINIEAEAVARFQHPNITQIYQEGKSADGPFLVLEYASGGSLADRLAGQPQPATKAAEIVHTLAKAVHHAHAQGVIHRDLKPNNVLLAGDGTLKITDFGLAKILESELGPTRTGDILGTAAYMAPEQAGGVTRHFGTACDVYSLGVILYELLTGRPPLVGEDRVNTLLLVLTEEPVPLCRLQPKTPRDLETICLKCLEKAPRRRYASAALLAEDLRRFLAHEPIIARRATRVDRAMKWVRRHPARALAATVAVLLPCLFLAGAAWHYRGLAIEVHNTETQRARAEVELLMAQDTVDEILRRMNDPAPLVDERKNNQRALLAATLKFCQGLLSENPRDPGVRWRTARAHLVVAGIYQVLAQPKEAEQEYLAGRELLNQLVLDSPDDRRYQRDLANACNNYGILLQSLGRTEDAETTYRQALALSRALSQASPDEPAYRRSLANTLNNAGALYRDTGRLAEAKEAFCGAREFFAALTKEFPIEVTYRLSLASTENNLGLVASMLSLIEEAEESYQQSLKLFDGLAAEMPGVVEYRQRLAATQNNRGWLLATAKRGGDAQAAFNAAKHLYEQDQDDPEAGVASRRGLATSLYGLGLLAIEAEDWPQAEEYIEPALRLRQELMKRQPENVELAHEVGLTLHAAAELMIGRGELRAARAYLEQAIEVERSIDAGQPSQVSMANGCHIGEMGRQCDGLAGHYRELAELLLRMGEPAAAADAAIELPRVARDGAAEYRRAIELLGQCFTLAEKIKAAQFDETAYARRAADLVREAADQNVVVTIGRDSALERAIRGLTKSGN